MYKGYRRMLEEAEIKLAQHYGFEGSVSDFMKQHDWVHDPLYWKFRRESKYALVSGM